MAAFLHSPTVPTIPANNPTLSEPTDAGDGYRWLLTPVERSRVASMLHCDVSEISLDSIVMRQNREVCNGCGKYVGLDDFVYNAKRLGVHSPAFMIDILRECGERNSDELECSECGTMYETRYEYV
ncbi:hypothetical protein EYZ11_013484 [Aspergillus tanneri]|uniref:RBP protein n=1 Tax=Aspergillus tanneri TaxID=1220188 RepID=A0A4S3IXJ0_9EURO|nr:uncharacterized protein ATNIH1004_005189 [Aspergillus tanneri]KAA8649288.1 hypothetical protein ATNIH1004_005189 [Aspergillus tanneri]THC87070.1 hypothetical protein EYZ11_013484 [Aspergillus tanneri]